MLRTGLQLSAAQRLAMTPALQQSLAVLQLPTAELRETLERELAANPLLTLEDDAYDPLEEEASDVPQPAAAPFDDPAGALPLQREASLLTWAETPVRDEGDDTPAVERLAAQETLAGHLRRQLAGVSIDPACAARAVWLIDSLDENGFLADPLEECAQGFPDGGTPEEWRSALELLQSLDPAGVGASDILDSLMLQARSRAAAGEVPEAAAELACAVLDGHAPELARHDWRSIASALGVRPEAVQEAARLIARLTPRPAAAFRSSGPDGAVIPEVLVSRSGGRWQAQINPQVVPRVRFDHACFDMLCRARLDPGQREVWKEKAHGARAFLHALELRFSSILAVAQTLVEAQEKFFDEGPQALQPMVLRDIAERLGVSESTVSRATAGKYMQTPRGTFELRFFFSSSVAGSSGEAVSSTAVRRRIRELVEAEDRARPLSDSAIASMLEREGVLLARRTVAKYRELENIAPRHLRKGVPGSRP